jgi:hypothetical protein
MNGLRVVALLGALIAVTCSADILAVQANGAVVNISSATGASLPVGSSGVSSLSSMAYLNGAFYAQEPNGPLLTVNPNTGAATATGVVAGNIVALTNGPNGYLYGMLNGDAVSTLVRLEGTAWQVVGDTGLINIIGLAYSPNGVMYGWSTVSGLVTVNPTTGVATDVNNAVGGGSHIDALAFTEDGRLFGCSSALYRVNLDGTTVLVGSGGYSNVTGMEFLRTKLLGVSNRDLYDIEPISGVATLIGPTGFTGLTSFCKVGMQWIAADSGTSRLVFLNPLTGAGAQGPAQSNIRGLSNGPQAGTLYGVRDTTLGNPDDLVKYTTSWSTIGSTGQDFIEGLTYSSIDGLFYGWDTARGLVHINPTTGAATDVNQSSDGDVLTATVEFGPDGKLYGAGDKLYRIDPMTGVRTEIGSTLPAFIRGLASGIRSQILLHTSTTLGPGLVFAGSPANIDSEDGQTYDLRPGVVFSSSTPPISLVISFSAPAPNPGSLTALASTFGTSNNVRERIEAFRFSDATYVTLVDRPFPTSLVPQSLDIPTPGSFVGANNEVRLRLSYRQVGVVFSYPWRARVDAVTVQFTP